MEINGVSTSQLYQLLFQTEDSQESNSVLSGDSAFSEILSVQMDQASTTSLSGGADMLSKLQQLASEDPEKFSETMNEIADMLESAAEEASEEDSQMLLDMAEKFRTAAETGDPSDLPAPPPPPPPPDTGMMGSGLAAYMQQDAGVSQSLLDLLSTEGENQSSILRAATGENDVKAVFDSIRDIINDAVASLDE